MGGGMDLQPAKGQRNIPSWPYRLARVHVAEMGCRSHDTMAETYLLILRSFLRPLRLNARYPRFFTFC